MVTSRRGGPVALSPVDEWSISDGSLAEGVQRPSDERRRRATSLVRHRSRPPVPRERSLRWAWTGHSSTPVHDAAAWHPRRGASGLLHSRGFRIRRRAAPVQRIGRVRPGQLVGSRGVPGEPPADHPRRPQPRADHRRTPLRPSRLAVVYPQGAGEKSHPVIRISHDGGKTWRTATGHPRGGGRSAPRPPDWSGPSLLYGHGRPARVASRRCRTWTRVTLECTPVHVEDLVEAGGAVCAVDARPSDQVHQEQGPHRTAAGRPRARVARPPADARRVSCRSASPGDGSAPLG